MIKMKRRAILKGSVAGLATVSLPKYSSAQTPPYTPDDLKSALTPLGGFRAGNADGTIPAWTGGYSIVPAGYQQGDPRPVPFADEDPVLVITPANASQYADKLPAGALAIFQKYSDFKMNIFTTHRTASAPQYVYDYTYKNATTAQLSADGNSISGAYGGLPFPIPKNGHEVMWNHLLAWSGTSFYFMSDGWTVTASGEQVLDTRVKIWFQYPYYFENGEDRFQGFYSEVLIEPIAPPYEAGGSIMIYNDPLNPYSTPVEGWEYMLGERRVRKAPELQYDTPDSLAGGVVNWDETLMFNGKLDKYDCKLVGIKEVYVPYNCNKAWTFSPAQQLGPRFLNPEIVRWELHRVRVVEMTLKAGARNVDARRTMYCDEDTGSILLTDIYDAQGSLWKFELNLPILLPDVPCVLATSSFITYDLHAGDYCAADILSTATMPQYKVVPEIPKSFFTAGQLAASAGGF